MSWNPDRYRRFEEERNRPIRDLIAGLGDPDPLTIVDAGCGPGNSTEALLHRFPRAEILAFDSDPAMVEAARKRLPGCDIAQADILDWKPKGRVDLFFSNAVFQWIPDHLGLLVRIGGYVAAGGAIAIQMPDNLDEPTHRLMVETAREGEWASAFGDGLPERTALPSPTAYMEALDPGGFEVTVWRTTYYHRLPDAAAIVDFVRGAGLRPWVEQVRRKSGQAAADAYLEAYRLAVSRAYPPLPDGSVVMTMPRLFVVARKEG